MKFTQLIISGTTSSPTPQVKKNRLKMAGFAIGSSKILPDDIVIIDALKKRPNSTFESLPPTNTETNNSQMKIYSYKTSLHLVV